MPALLLLISPSIYGVENTRAIVQAPAFSESAALTALTGFVRDTSGQVVEGAVLLLSADSNPSEIKSASSLADGRYLFEALPRGAYRVFAIKTGYAASALRINTILKNSLDLILRPSRAPDPQISRDLDWTLRLPSRDLLRATEASIADGSGGAVNPDISRASSSQAVLSSAGVPVDGEIQQWFSGDSPVAQHARAEATGSVTELRLAMRLGERLDLSVDGMRGREDSRIAEADIGDSGSSGRSTGQDRLGFAVGYDLAGASRLDMSATYGRDSLLLATRGAPRGTGATGESVTRSCAGKWKTTIGGDASLDFSAIYMDATAREIDGEIEPDPAFNRLWKAGGNFQTQFGGAHVVQVGVKARMLEEAGSKLFDRTPVGIANPMNLAGPTPAGWTVNLHGGEQWTIDRTVGLDVAIDYHRSLSVREAQLFTPSLGVTLSPIPSTRLKAKVSYSVDSFNGSTDTGLQASSNRVDTADHVGYDISLEQGFGERTTISFSTVHRPLAFDALDDEAGVPAIEDKPIYISNGEADSRETGIEVRRRFRKVTARAGMSRGTLAGRYAAAFPGEPLLALREGSLRYFETSVSVQTDGTGTELRTEYRTLSEDVTGYGRAMEQVARISVFLAQDLPFLHFGDTRWRLLLNCQNTLGGRHRSWTGGEESSRGPILAPQNRLSGGVSVQF